MCVVMSEACESDHLVELQRCFHAEALQDVESTLQENAIPYKKSSNAQIVSSAVIGGGSDPEVIISVKRSDYAQANAALEEAALQTPLPEDHHLLRASDDELLEIIQHPGEWSCYDVAHSRKLLSDKGISVSKEELDAINSQKRASLEAGQGVSKSRLLFAWIISILFPFGGLFAGILFSNKKEKTPLGVFYTYKRSIRIQGLLMSTTSALIIAAFVFDIYALWS